MDNPFNFHPANKIRSHEIEREKARLSNRMKTQFSVAKSYNPADNYELKVAKETDFSLHRPIPATQADWRDAGFSSPFVLLFGRGSGFA